MEKGYNPEAQSTSSLYRTLEDHRRGLLSFEELRKVYVDWSLRVIESSTPEGNKLVPMNLMLSAPEE